MIYATFANGLAYSFIAGEILTMETVIEDKVSQMVIEMMAKMHKMDAGEEKKSGLWDQLRNLYSLSPDSFPNDEKKAKR